jgi:hypothetical protein
MQTGVVAVVEMIEKSVERQNANLMVAVCVTPGETNLAQGADVDGMLAI